MNIVVRQQIYNCLVSPNLNPMRNVNENSELVRK